MKKSQGNYVCTSSQRKRILEWLRTKPMTTLEAREKLNIMHPSARVLELKAQGHNIKTHRETVGNGNSKHRVAKYVLLAGEL